MKTKRVFCGPADIAGNASKLARALRLVGVHATSYQRWKPIIDYSPDITEFYFKGIFRTNVLLRKINVLLLYIYFIKYLLRYKIFIFNNKKSLLPNNADLPILKFLKKIIVTQFGGCESRTYRNKSYLKTIICDSCTIENKTRLKCAPIEALENKIKQTEKFEKYSNYIFSLYDCYISKTKPFYWKGHIAELPPEKDYSKKMRIEPIVIAHFPTDRVLKGTQYIENVFKKINSEFNGKVVCKIIENISNSETLNELERTNILVDQLFLGYGANLAVEALARGCIVLEKIDENYSKDYSDHPYINTTKETLYDDLLTVLLFEKSQLIELSKRSQDFYYKYHTPARIGAYYKKVINI